MKHITPQNPAQRRNRLPFTQEKAISIFDTGTGGLMTALDLLRRRPNEIIHLCILNGARPMGGKTAAEIVQCINPWMEYLSQAKLMICACNTACTVPWKYISTVTGAPTIRMLQATARRAILEISTMDVEEPFIGVLSTTATALSHVFDLELEYWAQELKVPMPRVRVNPCHSLAKLIDEGAIAEDPGMVGMVEGYMRGMDDPSVLVLGCSTFAKFEDEFERRVPRHTKIINPNLCAVDEAVRLLAEHNLESTLTRLGAVYLELEEEDAEERRRLHACWEYLGGAPSRLIDLWLEDEDRRQASPAHLKPHPRFPIVPAA